MTEKLVQRWIDTVRPFDMDRTFSLMVDQYAASFGWDNDTREKFRKALLTLDKRALIENIRMFAEENFSEEVLKNAVEFFEAPLGKKYLEQRAVVQEGSQAMIVKFITASIKKNMGI